jgi:2-dehydropantoate 2-reductase
MTEGFVIWGAGAIGGTTGAYLARAGQDVLFIDRDAAHVEAINRDGLHVEGPIETFSVRVRAALPADLSGQFARILLCVKAQHTAEASTALRPHLAENGYVASFQNGLNEYVIGDSVGLQRVIGAFLNFGADYLGPGRITFGGRGAVVLGEMDGARTPRLLTLHAAMQLFEPRAVITDNIVGYLWGKLGYGALLFATAVTDGGIADVLGDPAHASVLTALGREVMAVARANAVQPEGFDGFDPAAFAPSTDTSASFAAMAAHNRKSAKTHSGIWRDLAVRHRPTEVDAQLGAVVTQAQARGIATPLLVRLIGMIHEIERGERRLVRANLHELAQAA